MSGYEIHQKSILDAARDLDAKTITSVELTKRCLLEINKHNNDLGALLWINEDHALSEATASDKRRAVGHAIGMLDGIPIALKDMILCKELPCTAGSRILEGYRPPYEAFVVTKLKSQGAVVIGKTNQDEFAMGSSNESSAYKICRNPWDQSRTPGGSSGGSAVAVSAGMCLGSLGTDTGGSIRQPASYCGLVGVKPSYGRVSRFGIIAFASSLDQVGPFAKNVSDAALLLTAIAGHDENDATSIKTPVPNYMKALNADIAGKKIGLPREYFAAGLNDEVRALVMSAVDILKKKGAHIVEIDLPHTKYAVATYYIIATAEASSNLSRYDGIRFGPRRCDGHDLLSLYEHTRGELFGAEVKRRIMLGTYVLSAGYYDAYYLKAQQVRTLLRRDYEKAFDMCDVVAMPTSPTPAFK